MKASLSSLIVVVCIALASLGVSHDAEAKRLGGGRSIGKPSNVTQNNTAQKQAAPTNATPTNAAPAAPVAPAAAAVAPKRPWGAMLGGLAAGLGIAALFSALGMGGQLASAMGSILMVLLLVGAVFFIWRMFKMRGQGGLKMAGASSLQVPDAKVPRGNDVGYYRHAGAEGLSSASFKPTEAATQTMSRFGSTPEGFDEAGFLATAKTHYTRLQQAWDSGNLADLERFCTPEMFGELKDQIAAREGVDKTDVVTLEAQLLGIEDMSGIYHASVEFSGLIREETFGGAAPFREIWNLSRDKNGQSGWLLTGIEQFNASVH
jgi:predicted lipid-binding transport protein (Tim44 family)